MASILFIVGLFTMVHLAALHRGPAAPAQGQHPVAPTIKTTPPPIPVKVSSASALVGKVTASKAPLTTVSSPAPYHGSQRVFIIGHAESFWRPGLSPAGRHRADCLVNLLKGMGIQRIYTPLDDDETNFAPGRALQTATPLAKILGLTPDTRFRIKEADALVKDIQSSGLTTVLVIWYDI